MKPSPLPGHPTLRRALAAGLLLPFVLTLNIPPALALRAGLEEKVEQEVAGALQEASDLVPFIRSINRLLLSSSDDPRAAEILGVAWNALLYDVEAEAVAWRGQEDQLLVARLAWWRATQWRGVKTLQWRMVKTLRGDPALASYPPISRRYVLETLLQLDAADQPVSPALVWAIRAAVLSMTVGHVLGDYDTSLKQSPALTLEGGELALSPALEDLVNGNIAFYRQQLRALGAGAGTVKPESEILQKRDKALDKALLRLHYISDWGFKARVGQAMRNERSREWIRRGSPTESITLLPPAAPPPIRIRIDKVPETVFAAMKGSEKGPEARKISLFVVGPLHFYYTQPEVGGAIKALLRQEPRGLAKVARLKPGTRPVPYGVYVAASGESVSDEATLRARQVAIIELAPGMTFFQILQAALNQWTGPVGEVRGIQRLDDGRLGIYV